MPFSGSWRSTLYTLGSADAAWSPRWRGVFEPGAVIRPFPEPVGFSLARARELQGPGFLLDRARGLRLAPGELAVPHWLALPGRSPGEALAPFAIGRMVSGTYRAGRRDGPSGNPRCLCYEVEAALGGAFGVARRVVPAGASLGEVEDVRTLAVRLGMLDQSIAAEAYADGAYLAGVYPAYCSDGAVPYCGEGLVSLVVAAVADAGVDAAEGFQEHEGAASPRGAAGVQRFDRLAGLIVPGRSGEQGPSIVDRAPPRPRTISVGWGWESPSVAGSEAFRRIVEGRAETLFAVDCQQGPGWTWDYDVSWLLDEVAPGRHGGQSATFWVGVWVTSHEESPIDYPEGGPRLTLPDGDDEPGTLHDWVAEESGAMGYWRLVGD